MKTETTYPASGPIALGLGVVANGFLFIKSLGFFQIPQGTFIRPMGWAMMVMMIAVVCLAVALPAAIHALRHGFPKKLSILAIILAVSPWPLSVGMMNLASWVKGFHLSS